MDAGARHRRAGPRLVAGRNERRVDLHGHSGAARAAARGRTRPRRRAGRHRGRAPDIQLRMSLQYAAMKNAQRTLLVVAAVFVASAGSVLVTAQAKTVWDGVYTEEQAARATAVFGSTCSNCHTLGTEGNRPLSGPALMDSFTQKTVGDLLNYVRTNMPNGVNAGTLPAATYNDLVALILKSNGFPAGTTEVTPEAVAKVQILPKDGS